jgi:hypothetical protein
MHRPCTIGTANVLKSKYCLKTNKNVQRKKYSEFIPYKIEVGLKIKNIPEQDIIF